MKKNSLVAAAGIPKINLDSKELTLTLKIVICFWRAALDVFGLSAVAIYLYSYV